MNADDKTRWAAGENDEGAPAPTGSGGGDADAVRRDIRSTPGSETETEQKQADPIPDSLDDDIDSGDVRAVPGTGGPDDVGDVDIDPGELNLPFDLEN